MSQLIGGSGIFSTWGKLRCTYARNTWDPDTDISAYNSTYISGLKSAADGSGLIRIANYGTRSVVVNHPRMRSTFMGPGDGYEIFTQGGPGLPPIPFTVEVGLELIGEDMTFAAASVTLTSEFCTSPYVQQDASPSEVGDIVSVGKLEAFP
jgi:hypothetical protein